MLKLVFKKKKRKKLPSIGRSMFHVSASAQRTEAVVVSETACVHGLHIPSQEWE